MSYPYITYLPFNEGKNVIKFILFQKFDMPLTICVIKILLFHLIDNLRSSYFLKIITSKGKENKKEF